MSLPSPTARRSCPAPAKDLVVLLAGSPDGPGSWTSLAGALSDFAPVSFDLMREGSKAAWRGSNATLGEAAAIEDAVPEGAPFHLVGHAYSGAVALRYALARPGRLLSLTLVEPSAFHVLKFAAADEARFMDEIREVSEALNIGVFSGDHESAMEAYIDYWSGGGSWRALPDERRAELSHFAGHVAHHFWGLMEDPTPLTAYSEIDVPTLVISGTRSPAPTRAITRLIAGTMRDAQHRTIAGASHMSLTQSAAVNRHIARHIAARRAPPAAVDRMAA